MPFSFPSVDAVPFRVDPSPFPAVDPDPVPVPGPGPDKMVAKSTANEETCSHLPFPNASHSLFLPNASNTAQRILVSKCRPVIHSVQRTIACGTRSSASTARVMVVLHVADIPCTTTVAGLGVLPFSPSVVLLACLLASGGWHLGGTWLGSQNSR